MKAKQVVDTLLEMHPKEWLARLPGEYREVLIKKFPQEVQEILRQGNQFGPDLPFLEAILNGKEASWQVNDADDLPLWPYDAGDGWEVGIYYCLYEVKNRQLWVKTMLQDIWGDQYTAEHAEHFDSPEYHDLRQRYGKKTHLQAMIDYFQYVVETGVDRHGLIFINLGGQRLSPPRGMLKRVAEKKLLKLQQELAATPPDMPLVIIP